MYAFKRLSPCKLRERELVVKRHIFGYLFGFSGWVSFLPEFL